ncbi:GGDEF domain-containing protein [Actinotalea sp. K2]|uniref:GGDEF domain-containing protein n=1 Tax=Actinotalea sp. K2 TaxID=2939438 RepID=UPI002017D86F|nr:GGDEF domain-containing protein [Actinotalea sp. K2]MCL3859534.1 GGDEF domain-containing protein [Actinotalea sp. K2]
MSTPSGRWPARLLARVPLDRLGPRNALVAARTAAGLAAVGGAATVMTELVAHSTGAAGPSTIVLTVGTLVLLGGGVLWVLRRRIPAWMWGAVATASVVPILGVNLATRDASGGAQIAFLLPVVYAGAFLRAGAAWSVAGVAIVANAVVVFSVLPLHGALNDFPFVLAVVVALTSVLVASGHRQDRLVDQLTELLAVDPVSGVFTRRAFTDAAQVVLDEPLGRGAALLIMDLDRFKCVNDTHGHPVGDAVLGHVAAVTRDHCGSGAVVGRLGGDEFAVLLPDVRAAEARARAVGLLAALARTPLVLDELVLEMSVSVGVAHTHEALPVSALYESADAALYDAKRAGRGQVALAAGPVARTG